MCVRRARLVNNLDKQALVPNFKYVFHAELEINLNWNFNNNLERWCLYFTHISLPLDSNDDIIVLNDCTSFQLFLFRRDILLIHHNAKTKYCCLTCQNDWTSARGRAIFQAQYPRNFMFNFLYVSLCTQQCRLCNQEVQPSWYLNEVTRVMKNV